MMIKKDHDEVFYWYKKIQEFNKSGMSPKRYCDQNQIEYKKFSNMRYRVEYKSKSDPGIYNQYLPLTKRYIESGEKASVFSKENKIDIRILSEMVTHVGYLEIIEKKLKEEESKPMQFIQVPTLPISNGDSPIEAEVVKKQNDIELIISAGVKVMVAPEVGADKLIRIIELLKDL